MSYPIFPFFFFSFLKNKRKKEKTGYYRYNRESKVAEIYLNYFIIEMFFVKFDDFHGFGVDQKPLL